jgi:hypothetical protein
MAHGHNDTNNSTTPQSEINESVDEPTTVGQYDNVTDKKFSYISLGVLENEMSRSIIIFEFNYDRYFLLSVIEFFFSSSHLRLEKFPTRIHGNIQGLCYKFTEWYHC